MSKCDCLNFCGDDPRLVTNQSLRCPRYEKYHRYDQESVLANLFKTLNENMDATMLNVLVQASEEKDLSKRYRMLRDHLIQVQRKQHEAKSKNMPIIKL